MDTSSPVHDAAPDADAFERARAAVAALRGQGRRPDGTAGAGNTIAMRDGLRSQRLWSEPAVAAWHRERVEELRADLGADVSHVRGSLLESFARCELVEASLSENVFQHGPLTGKGRTRAAASLLLSVMSHKAKLASLIGLERKPKPVATLADYLNGTTDGAAR